MSGVAFLSHDCQNWVARFPASFLLGKAALGCAPRYLPEGTAKIEPSSKTGALTSATFAPLPFPSSPHPKLTWKHLYWSLSSRCNKRPEAETCMAYNSGDWIASTIWCWPPSQSPFDCSKHSREGGREPLHV